MDCIKIILPFPPSSNTAYPTVKRGHKNIRIKSANLKKWISSAPDLSEYKIPTPCTISYKMFFPDDRERDGQSYLKVPLDYLVKQGCLPDDNRKYVKGEQWLDYGNDKKNPRVEMIIKKWKPV